MHERIFSELKLLASNLRAIYPGYHCLVILLSTLVCGINRVTTKAHSCATFWGTPEWAQVSPPRVNSPTSRAATPCHGSSRKARASNRSTLLELTASDPS
eukprot:4975112-Pleurochrysis_carterae.AAC.1